MDIFLLNFDRHMLGTFITTDISLCRLEHIQTVNIRDMVRHIKTKVNNQYSRYYVALYL
jgi:uncharacterized protein YacL